MELKATALSAFRNMAAPCVNMMPVTDIKQTIMFVLKCKYIDFRRLQD